MRTLLALAATALGVAVFTPVTAEAAPLSGLSLTTGPAITTAVEQAHYYRRRHCCYRSYGYYGGGYPYGAYGGGYPYSYYGYGGPVIAFSFGGHRHHRHW